MCVKLAEFVELGSWFVYLGACFKCLRYCMCLTLCNTSVCVSVVVCVGVWVRDRDLKFVFLQPMWAQYGIICVILRGKVWHETCVC